MLAVEVESDRCCSVGLALAGQTLLMEAMKMEGTRASVYWARFIQGWRI
jgi:hypothetical protein